MEVFSVGLHFCNFEGIKLKKSSILVLVLRDFAVEYLLKIEILDSWNTLLPSSYSCFFHKELSKTVIWLILLLFDLWSWICTVTLNSLGWFVIHKIDPKHLCEKGRYPAYLRGKCQNQSFCFKFSTAILEKKTTKCIVFIRNAFRMFKTFIALRIF